MSIPDPNSASGPAPFRQIFTSVEKNIDMADWSIDAKLLDLPAAAPLSISKRRLYGGRQHGVDLIRIDNGRIALTVIPTRGMGILNVESAELPLGWKSPVREVIHPHFINLSSRGGLGWLEGFNEWLVRCGLEFAGAPGRDKFTTNTGAKTEMDLTLHGKIANLPASEVELIIDRAPPYRVRLRGRVDETMLFGPKLELWTELSLEPHAREFRVEDTITNRGGADQEFELIYHINFGAPLLESGARFVGPMKRVTPINAHAAQAIANYAAYDGPTAGFVEQVYCMEPLADADGRSTVLLRNAAANRAASVSFDVERLPCFTLWKNTNSIEEGYVTGLEPGTCFPNNRSVERRAGRLPFLEPGQSRQCALDFGLHTTAEEVAAVVRRITAVQDQEPAQVDLEPAKQV